MIIIGFIVVCPSILKDLLIQSTNYYYLPLSTNFTVFLALFQEANSITTPRPVYHSIHTGVWQISNWYWLNFR